MDICGFFALFKLASKIVISSFAGGMPPDCLSSYRKISAAMRLIPYGILADYTDEYRCIGENTTLKCVRLFAKLLIRIFGHGYLRAPNEDTKKFMVMNEAR
mgnify:CR=1 FL=1